MKKTIIDFLPSFVVKSIKNQKIKLKELDKKTTMIWTSFIYSSENSYCYKCEESGLEIEVNEKTDKITTIRKHHKILYTSDMSDKTTKEKQ